MKKEYARLGTIARFKPLHNGSARMISVLCDLSDYVLIGIGSANKYNLRNPFTKEETKGMIDAYLDGKHKNYEILFIDDYAHLPEYRDGKRWASEIKSAFGTLDAFVSANGYVSELLSKDYHIIHPAVLIPQEDHVLVNGTAVRVEIAKYGDWKKLVPFEVASYLQDNGLINRFRQEFGLSTLIGLQERDHMIGETKEDEIFHSYEV